LCQTFRLKNIFFGCPIWLPIFCFLYFVSFQLLNEPGLGAGINPGMDLTPFPSNIGWDSNPQPSNRKSSLLTTIPDFCPKKFRLKINQFCLKLFNGLFPHDNKEVQWFSTFLKSQNFWNIFKHLAEPGVNFINILQTDPESAKKTVKSSVFCSFGISASKSFS